MLKCEETSIPNLSLYKGIKILKPKDFNNYCMSHDVRILGHTKLEEISKKKPNKNQSDDYIDTGNKSFYFYKKSIHKPKGYIPITDTTFVAIERKKLKTSTHVAILACCVVAILGITFYNDNRDKGLTGNVWDGETNNEDTDLGNDSIAIPGYTVQAVNKKNPCIVLGNPDINDVYFTYHIYDENNDEIYTSDYIHPGEKDDWNVYDMIQPGEHEFRFLITTCDLEDKDVAYNSADIKVKVIR